MAALRVGILTAMDIELAPIVSELDLRTKGDDYVGEIDDLAITARFVGIGRQRAVDGVKKLHADCEPALMVLAGFAGGLDPFLQAGYVCAPRRVMIESGESIELEAEGDRTLLTVDQPVAGVQVKQALREQHSADAVDMESFYAAHAAAELGCELMIIKTISDAADESVPTWALDLVTQDGRTSRMAGVWAAMSHPRRIDAMFRLRRSANEAGRSLGISVASHLARWTVGQG